MFQPLTEGKKNIISVLIDEYDIQTVDDIREALKDILGGTIKSMMEFEMTEHLGYEKSGRSDSDNYRSAALLKTLYLSTLQVTKKWNQPIHG